jgi:hypothetical protein
MRNLLDSSERSFFASGGTENGQCTSIRCFFAKTPRRATWYNKSDKNWVCLSCAQDLNRQAIQGGYKTPCISGDDFLAARLKGEM